MGFYGRRMVPEYLIKKLEKGPVKLKDITNITELTDDEINALEAGDIVLKKTSNQYHAYIVSYKEDNQGICLTYTDASRIETVSYDYTGGHWIYNSTDVTLMSEKQDKLTAGSGIEINEDNVISATGGGKQLYIHNVLVYLTDSQGDYVGDGYFYIIIINDNNSVIDTISKLHDNYGKIIGFKGYDSDSIQSNFGINPIYITSFNIPDNELEILFDYVDNGKLNSNIHTFEFNFDLDSVIPL